MKVLGGLEFFKPVRAWRVFGPIAAVVLFMVGYRFGDSAYRQLGVTESSRGEESGG